MCGRWNMFYVCNLELWFTTIHVVCFYFFFFQFTPNHDNRCLKVLYIETPKITLLLWSECKQAAWELIKSVTMGGNCMVSFNHLFLAKVSSGVHSGNQTETCSCSYQLHVAMVSAALFCQHEGLLRLQNTETHRQSSSLYRLGEIEVKLNSFRGN